MFNYIVYILYIVLTVAIFYGLDCLLDRYWRKTNDNSFRQLGAMAIGFVLWAYTSPYLYEERPNAWREKSYYEGEFYVNVFPDGNNEKNYRVVAFIEADQDEYDDGESFHLSRFYRINKFKLNGRTYDSLEHDESLEVGKKVYVYDYDLNRSWEIELTDKKVK